MGEKRDAAGRYVALERELFARGREDLEEDIEAAVLQPSAEILAWLGPVPEVDDPAREEWEDVVRELETDRLIAEGELPAAELNPRELRDLHRRIEGLRELRDLEPRLDPAGPNFDLAA
jgi:hypothetical protein